MYTIDYLISELNHIAQRPSAEALRIQAITGVRHILTRIGLELTGTQGPELIQVVRNVFVLPARIIKVLDVGVAKGHWQGMDLSVHRRSSALLAFSRTKKELYFPNLDQGEIWALTVEFFVNEDREPVIPEEAYAACKAFCTAEILKNQPANPLFGDRWQYDGQVDGLIRIARGELNQQTPAQLRTNRRY